MEHNSTSFDFVNMFAEFPFTQDAFLEANDTVFGKTLPIDSNQNVPFEPYQLVAAVEHEYFHCRHMCSSSIGYLLFTLRQRITVTKRKLISGLPFSELAGFLGKANDLLQVLERSLPKHAESAISLVQVMIDEVIWDIINDFNKQNLQAFLSIRDSVLGKYCIYLDDETKTTFPLLTNIEVPDNFLEAVKNKPSLQDIIEGLAIWKEYAYISNSLWYRHGGKFHEYTRRWLQLIENKKRYRSVVDLVLESTGHNMSMAITGVLLDLALSSPCWSMKAKKWDEVHPSLRLLRILSVVDRLPKIYRKPDNIDLVDANYYHEIERIINKLLGWTDKEQNLKDTLDAISVRQASTRNIQSDHTGVDLLRIIYEPRFCHGVTGELLHPGTQLFPWNNPYKDLLGLFTMPPLVLFLDKIVINPLPTEPKQIYLLHLNDVVITLFVNSLIDHSSLPFKARTSFAKARKLYNNRKTAFEKEDWYKFQTSVDNSYEDFISYALNLDYTSMMECLRRNGVC